MSNINDSADFIRRQARLLQGFVDAADTLDKIGSFEQATKEAQAALTAKNNELSCVSVALETAQGALDDANTKATQILADAKYKSNTLIDDAVKAAKVQAENTAGSIIARAKSDAEPIIAKQNSEIAALELMRGKCLLQANDAKQALEDMKAEIRIKQDQLNSLNLSLDAIKQKFGA